MNPHRNPDSAAGNTLGSVVALALFLLAPSVGGAAAVYRWVDEAGVTHFSEAPPETPAGEVQTLDVPEPGPRADPENDYYSIANQSKRMEAVREERERARAERDLARRRLELQAQQAQAVESLSATEPTTQYRYPPAYGPPYWAIPPRPWPGPHPPGVGPRPPHPPTWVEPYRHPYNNWRGYPGRIRHN
jgi:hypothetical protein